MTEPIVAIATAPGRGGIGVVRVSGRNLVPLMTAVLGREIAPRQAVYAAFKDRAGEAIDRGVALYFPAPHSYTGEAVLELQGQRVRMQSMPNWEPMHRVKSKTWSLPWAPPAHSMCSNR